MGPFCMVDATTTRRPCRLYYSSLRRQASRRRVALIAVRPINGNVSRLGRRRSSEGRVTAALRASTPSRFETTKNEPQSINRISVYPFAEKFPPGMNFRTLRHSGMAAKRVFEVGTCSAFDSHHEPLRFVWTTALR